MVSRRQGRAHNGNFNRDQEGLGGWEEAVVVSVIIDFRSTESACSWPLGQVGQNRQAVDTAAAVCMCTEVSASLTESGERAKTRAGED